MEQEVQFEELVLKEEPVQVWKGFYAKEECLVKVLNAKNTQEAQTILTQAQKLVKVTHSNLARIKECTVKQIGTEVTQVWFIVEYFSKGNLNTLIQQKALHKNFWEETELLDHYKQLLETACFLENQGIPPSVNKAFVGPLGNLVLEDLVDSLYKKPQNEVYTLGLLFLKMALLNSDLDPSNFKNLITDVPYSQRVKSILSDMAETKADFNHLKNKHFTELTSDSDYEILEEDSCLTLHKFQLKNLCTKSKLGIGSASLEILKGEILTEAGETSVLVKEYQGPFEGLVEQISVCKQLSELKKNFLKFYGTYEEPGATGIVTELPQNSLSKCILKRKKTMQHFTEEFLVKTANVLIDNCTELAKLGLVHSDLNTHQIFLADELVIGGYEFVSNNQKNQHPLSIAMVLVQMHLLKTNYEVINCGLALPWIKAMFEKASGGSSLEELRAMVPGNSKPRVPECFVCSCGVSESSLVLSCCNKKVHSECLESEQVVSGECGHNTCAECYLSVPNKLLLGECLVCSWELPEVLLKKLPKSPLLKYRTQMSLDDWKQVAKQTKNYFKVSSKCDVCKSTSWITFTSNYNYAEMKCFKCFNYTKVCYICKLSVHPNRSCLSVCKTRDFCLMCKSSKVKLSSPCLQCENCGTFCFVCLEYHSKDASKNAACEELLRIIS